MPNESLRERYFEVRDSLLELCSHLKSEIDATLEHVEATDCDVVLAPLKEWLAYTTIETSPQTDPVISWSELIRGRIVVDDQQALREVEAALSRSFNLAVQPVGVLEHLGTRCYRVPPTARVAGVKPTPVTFTVHFFTRPAAGDAEPDAALSAYQPISLVLSGGGTRAALFQLGIVVYLAEQNELKSITEITSVSGGSILSAHLAKNWTELISGRGNFQRVAGELITMLRGNIRDQVFVPWLWSRLLPLWTSRRLSRSQRLRKVYELSFGDVTLGELTSRGAPNLAFVATDTQRSERVALTSGGVYRFPMQNVSDEDLPDVRTITSTGLPVSLAVATSCCFPAAFHLMQLTHVDLGLTYEECRDTLNLSDGGISSNLGLEVLLALRCKGWTKNATTVVADAECLQASRPSPWSLMSTINVPLASQSRTERAQAEQELGANLVLVRFADRTSEDDDGWKSPGPQSLSFTAETALASYRTDLDCPTWDECYALMLHGAFSAWKSMRERHQPIESGNLRKAVLDVLAAAGGDPD